MTASHELRIQRLIDAPRAAVWRAWTDHQPEWFCPRSWRAEVVAMDLRAGGQSAMTMRGPVGEENEIEGVFLEVEPSVRVVSADAFAPSWQPQGPFMLRIDEFADNGDGTRYSAVTRHWTAEARAQHEAIGFAAGCAASANQLAEVARRIARG